MKHALIIAQDPEHARAIESLLEEHGLADQVLVAPDPTNDIGAHESLHRLASLGTLAAGAAHEVNNLLTYVSVTLDRLSLGYRRSSDAIQNRTAIVSAIDCCHRMQQLLRGITGFARHGSATRDPLLIADVVRDALALVKHDLDEHAAVETSFDPELPVLRGNAGELSQVFVNLLINAVHAFTDDQRGRVDVRVRRDPDAGGIRIVIEDNGCGMTSEQLDRVFEAFYSTKPEGKGAGLGLFLARAIVRRHGGELAIESSKGRGTRVSVYLPAE